jgi:hypothetical protein
MPRKVLFGDSDYYRAFPDPKDVFARRVRGHAAALLPVGSLSLGFLSPRWNGLIHFLLPVEPVGGCGRAGEEGANEFGNYLCRPNWVGYRLTGNKCELACDLRFFRKALYADRVPQTAEERAEAEELERHYRREHEEFDRRAAFYREHGWLCQWPDQWTGAKRDVKSLRAALVRDLGGTSWHGNWANSGDFPKSKYPAVREGYDTFRAYPRTEDGRDFHFVGSVEMWNYLGDTNGTLLLFYDPEQQVALTTVDWS